MIDALSAAIVGLFEVVRANLRKAHDSRKLRANRGYQVCTGKHLETSWILSGAHFARRAERNLRESTDRAREDNYLRTVGLPNQIFPNHLCRGAGLHNPPSMKEHHRFAKSCRSREVVEHHDDGHLALTIQRPQEIEDRDLMVNVEVRVGLVKHEDGRLLGNGSGNQHTLLFAAGKLGDRPVTKITYSGSVHSFIDNLPVPIAHSFESIKMRKASHGNDVRHRERKFEVLLG